jgi:AcrR family transcriptional regulator
LPRTAQRREKRAVLLPLIARAFTELGYRRATTAELARRCRVQENILYRLWSDKKAMFLAAIDYVYEFSERTWLRVLPGGRGSAGSARRLLEYETRHHGEFGHYRILFTALAETDDPDIRDALRRMFMRFHRFLAAQIAAHRPRRRPSPALTAWAVIGLGTVANIGRELELMSDADRRRLIGQVGRELLEGQATGEAG